MTLYTELPDNREPFRLSELKVGAGEYIGAFARGAAADMPSVGIARGTELSIAKGELPYFDDPINMLEYQRDNPDYRAGIGGDVAIAAAKARVKSEGLEEHLHLGDQPTVKGGALDLMIRHAHERREREATLARGPDGFFPTAGGYATSFLVGALDPLNLASAFIPIMGEARYGKLLANAGDSVLRRTAVRGAVGAGQGAAGMVPITALEAWQRSQEGQDFTMADALHNVVFGAGLGGLLHGGGGAIGDVFRRVKGRPLYQVGESRPQGETPAETEPRPPPVEPPADVGRTTIDINGERTTVDTDLAAVREAAKPAEEAPPAAPVREAAPEPPRAPEPDTAARQAVHDDVLEQLRAAGVPDEEAAQNAAVVAARYATRAERLGGEQSAHELYRAEGLQVRAGKEAGTALASAAARGLAVVSEKGDGAINALHALAGLRGTSVAIPIPEIKTAGNFVDAVAALRARRTTKAPERAPAPAKFDDVIDAEILGETPPRSFNQGPAERQSGYAENFDAERDARELVAAPEEGTTDRSGIRPLAIDVKAFRDEAEAMLGVARQHDGFELPADVKELTRVNDSVADLRDMIDDHAGIGQDLVERLEKFQDEHYARIEAARDGFEELEQKAKDFADAIAEKQEELIDAHLAELYERREAEEEAAADVARARGEVPYPLPALVEEAPRPAYPRDFTALDVVEAELRDLSALFKRMEDDPAVKALLEADVEKLDQAAADRLIDAADAATRDISEVVVGSKFWWDKTDNLANNFHATVNAIRDDVVVPLLDAMEEASETLHERVIEGIDKAASQFRTYDQAKRPRDLVREREAQGQLSLAGTDRIGQGEQAQRRADAPLKPKVVQKAADEGLFGDGAKQKSFFQSPTAPTFYSAVERTVASAKQEKASADQWLGMIKNAAGVKAEEMEWLGLADWLKAQKGAVSKDAIVDYVRANRIEVKEVERGGPDVSEEVRAAQRERDAAREAYVATENGTPEAEAALNRLTVAVEADGALSRQSKTQSTKFSSWMTPKGLENERELVLTLPQRQADVVSDRYAAELDESGAAWTVVDRETGEPMVFGTVDHDRAWAEDYARSLNTMPSAERYMPPAGHSYGDEASDVNRLAHIFTADATIDGEKTLLIREGQSDWHQAGHKQGYKSGQPALTPDEMRELQTLRMMGNDVTKSDALYERYSELQERYAADSNAVPDAPFKTTWPALVLKRMIRYAAENGYEKLAWVTGDTVAERYNLGQHVKSIETSPPEGGKYRITIHPKDGEAQTVEKAAGELPEFLGKDLADKIVKHHEPDDERYYGHRVWSDLDLRIGAGFHRKLYDDVFVREANKLVKKYGAKVEEGEISEGGAAHQMRYEGRDLNASAILQLMQNAPENEPQSVISQLRAIASAVRSGTPLNVAMETYGSHRAAEILGGKMIRIDVAVHTLPITPELRKVAVEQGFPLFQKDAEGGPRGRITLSDNQAVVELFKGADQSTFMHEMGHKWLDELAHDASLESVPQALKDDLGTVLRWLGVDKAEDIGKAQHERWASGFEQYLTEGRAPSSALARAFDHFKRWLTAIYKSLADLGTPINDDIRGVMDRMLASDREIAERRPIVDALADLPPRAKEDAMRGAAAALIAGEPVRVGEMLEAAAKTDPRIAESLDIATKHVTTGGRGPRARDPETWSLLEFIAARGGIDPADALIGDVRALFGGKRKFIPGFGDIVRKGGMRLDRMREAAVEAGYIHDEGHVSNKQATSTISTLLEAMDSEARGQKIYKYDRLPEHAQAAERERVLEENSRHADEHFDEGLTEVGIDPAIVPDKTRARVVEIMAREGESDPLVAYERAVMEETHDGAAAGQHERVEDIPGWDVPHDAGAAPGAGRDAALDGQPRAREPARGAGGGDREARAVNDGAWRELSQRTDTDVGAAASKAADAAPDPGSWSTKAAERVAASEKSATEAAEAYRESEASIPDDIKVLVEAKLREIEAEVDDRAEVIKRSAACLAGAV